MEKRKLIIVLSALGFILMLLVGLAIYVIINAEPNDGKKPDISIINNSSAEGVAEIKQFKSEIEFKNFIASINAYQDGYGYGAGGDDVFNMKITDSFAPTLKNDGATREETSIIAEDRYSTTNTQVLSIDEADIVKTNGETLFYSVEKYGDYYYDEPIPLGTEVIEKRIIADEYYPQEYNPISKTYIIDALPIEDLSIKSEIEDAGQLYLDGDILIIEKYNKYTAYDVSNVESPEKVWEYSFDDNSSLISSRMYNGDLYIVTGRYFYEETPCDYPILMEDSLEKVTVNCTDIYYPDIQLDSAQTVTVSKIKASDGSIKDTVSFMGSSWNTTVYMSEENIYVTYPENADSYEIVSDFISKNEDLFTPAIIERVEKLESYEITTNSKLTEIENLLDEYTRFMDSDEKLTFENNLQNRFDTYTSENVRSFSGTGLVKINANNLSLEATGKFQGTLLNQFSIDEYNGFLRVATTVNGGWWNRWFQGNAEQANDVVVMDSDLHVVGEIRDLGITESIYSARFIGDRAYVVTFRQIDPFYVLDMSDPTNPEMKGELKIPGYSSYLHPISDNMILGVGQENSRVKISLFDVSDPTNPIEASKYSVADYWSEVESNHHAFLLDKKHEVFFIPGGNGGYIFSYASNRIELVKSISSYDNVKRAVYIDDYMYIFSENDVTVIDENTWKSVKTLDLD